MSDPLPPPLPFVSAPGGRPPTIPYQSPNRPVSGAVSCHGHLLVCAKDARLPDRCIKCNAPATTHLKRKLTWHHPLFYLLILPGLLIYAVVALIVQKRGTIYVGLCEKHRKRRLTLILTASGLFVLSLAGFGAAIAMESGSIAALSLIPLFAAPFVAIAAGRVVTVDHIDDHFVYLKGVNREFMVEQAGQ